MANNFRWRGNEVARIVRQVGMDALHDGAEHILTEAIDETPIDTGTLRRSGTVTDVPSEDSVYISFNTPYAIRMHEDLTYTPRNGGGPKYLENPFRANERRVKNLVSERVRRALQSTR